MFLLSGGTIGPSKLVGSTYDDYTYIARRRAISPAEPGGFVSDARRGRDQRRPPMEAGDQSGTDVVRVPAHGEPKRASCARLSASDVYRWLPARPGGQGVAGSNPVVPTARWAVPYVGGAAHQRFYQRKVCRLLE